MASILTRQGEDDDIFSEKQNPPATAVSESPNDNVSRHPTLQSVHLSIYAGSIPITGDDTNMPFNSNSVVTIPSSNSDTTTL